MSDCDVLLNFHNITVPPCLSFSLSGSDEFMVSPVEGELRVRRDVELDREVTAFYNITITARDLGNPPRSSSVGVQRNTHTHFQ